MNNGFRLCLLLTNLMPILTIYLLLTGNYLQSILTVFSFMLSSYVFLNIFENIDSCLICKDDIRSTRRTYNWTFNLLHYLLGYNYYSVKMNKGYYITLITKQQIKVIDWIDISNVKRIDDYTFIQLEEKQND